MKLIKNIFQKSLLQDNCVKESLKVLLIFDSKQKYD